MDITIWLWCLGGGALAGLLAGLLGIGGGLVVVPLLIYLLPVIGVAPELVVPSAIATSLATICMTTASAALTHSRTGYLERFWLIRVLPGLSVGALLGAFLVTVVNPEWLKLSFAAVLVILSRLLMVETQMDLHLILNPQQHLGRKLPQSLVLLLQQTMTHQEQDLHTLLVQQMQQQELCQSYNELQNLSLVLTQLLLNKFKLSEDKCPQSQRNNKGSSGWLERFKKGIRRKLPHLRLPELLPA